MQSLEHLITAMKRKLFNEAGEQTGAGVPPMQRTPQEMIDQRIGKINALFHKNRMYRETVWSST